MDPRIPLQVHSLLAFEGMSCHIEEVVGQGSNAIVYRGWYPDSMNRELRHRVLVKELYPFHPMNKIWRDAAGSIVVEPEAQELWDTHKKSFQVGNTVHLRLLYDHPDMMVMGANLNSYRLNGTLYSVLGYSGGRSLQEELGKNTATLRATAQRMIALLDALEAFHGSGYLHLDISPDNIMLVGQQEQERVFLIDYNSAREAGSGDTSYLSCKAGYSPPEVSTGNPAAIGFASDLYSVAAVFFRSLMGRSLTLAETLQPKAPDAQDSPLLEGMPQTVSAMVGSILKKGLNTLARRRYQTIEQMRQAFQELLERIDGVGVSHWSVWESGKRSVEELIRINPSLRYLKEESKLYPIRLACGESLSLEQYLDRILSPGGKSGMILAQGGMGKTTLLLHTAMLRGKTYSATSPAVFYVSLNGCDKADTQYIRTQILMRLRFKKDENSFGSAMHALHKLLEQPLQTKQGEIPSVLLLLDGVNEIRGSNTAVVQEIRELQKMAGVRILAASRSNLRELELETANLMYLQAEDIEEALGRNGLLIPQKQNILQLLRTPLILSIYIQASAGGRQLNIRSEEELMKAYMDSLLEKEIWLLPEDAPQRWQTDAALNFVLPAIAEQVRKKGRSLTQRQLLRVIKKCRKTLHSPLLQKAFPQWIGHTRDIFCNAAKVDEWYAVIVHELLWQRFGMLMKDANGRYHVFHQAISEYLAKVYRTVAARTRRSANPVTVVALIWCVIQLLTWFDDYSFELRSDLSSVAFRCDDPYREQDVADFYDVLSAVNSYLAAPDDTAYQAARAIAKQALVELPEQFAFHARLAEDERLYQYNERYDEYNLTELSLSKMDAWILKLYNIDPQYLTEPFRGYIAGTGYAYGRTPVTNDYIEMICALDVLVEGHRSGEISAENLAEVAELLDSMHENRVHLMIQVRNYYFESASSERVLHIEELRQSLEAYADEFKGILKAYPPELQEQIRERADTFKSWSFGWEKYTQEIFQGTPVIPDYPAPEWLPENPDYCYLSMDPVFLDVAAQPCDPEKTLPAVQPLAVYTVCYGVTREELTRYLDTLTEGAVPYRVNEQSGVIQVFVSFEEMTLTVNWTPLHTVLIFTGAEFRGNG